MPPVLSEGKESTRDRNKIKWTIYIVLGLFLIKSVLVEGTDYIFRPYLLISFLLYI